jgi:hypothetical protein
MLLKYYVIVTFSFSKVLSYDVINTENSKFIFNSPSEYEKIKKKFFERLSKFVLLYSTILLYIR